MPWGPAAQYAARHVVQELQQQGKAVLGDLQLRLAVHCAGQEGFWNAAQTLEQIQQVGYFKPQGSEQSQPPPALQARLTGCEPHCLLY